MRVFGAVTCGMKEPSKTRHLAETRQSTVMHFTSLVDVVCAASTPAGFVGSFAKHLLTLFQPEIGAATCVAWMFGVCFARQQAFYALFCKMPASFFRLCRVSNASRTRLWIRRLPCRILHPQRSRTFCKTQQPCPLVPKQHCIRLPACMQRLL